MPDRLPIYCVGTAVSAHDRKRPPNAVLHIFNFAYRDPLNITLCRNAKIADKICQFTRRGYMLTDQETVDFFSTKKNACRSCLRILMKQRRGDCHGEKDRASCEGAKKAAAGATNRDGVRCSQPDAKLRK